MSFEDKQHVCSDCWITARDAERQRILDLLKVQRLRYGSVLINELIELLGVNK